MSSPAPESTQKEVVELLMCKYSDETKKFPSRTEPIITTKVALLVEELPRRILYTSVASVKF